MENEQYYIDNENRRIEHLKRNTPELLKDFLDREDSFRDDLIINLLKYKNKEQWFKIMKPMVSLRYIDTLREFLKLDETKINSLKTDRKIEFQDISKKFISFIPEKVKKEYESKENTSIKSNQKYLFFLKLNELLK
jgi:hypothetical protein